MDDGERRSAKRSRFDQTEPEPRKASRFDRRSRSPPARKSDSGRDRSPISRGSRGRDSSTPDVKSPVDPAAAAAAAAAKINAQLQARRGIQHVDVPPVRSASTANKDGAAPSVSIDGEVQLVGGDYIKDIEVNDLRNRYLLTKGGTQKMIKDETGADVTTRGSYYPDKSMATPTNPPLYLHVTSTTKEGLDKAVAKIEELMKQELPQLVDERRFRRRDQEQQQVERDEYGRRKWPEERLTIGLESLPGFNLRAQVVGHGGAYVKHIQQETGCRVQIKGRGSGYIENATGQESEDEMFLHVTGPDIDMVKKAKELCEDLMSNVRQQYEDFKSRPPRGYGGGGGGGGGGGSGGYGDRPHNTHNQGGGQSYQGYNNNTSHHNNQGNSYSNSPTSVAPTSASPTPAAAGSADYAAQYAALYNGADPYAAYGGYAAYAQMYAQWYAAQAAQAGGAAAAPGTSGSPPPPPSEAAPPPPPPSAAPPPPPSGPPGMGGYGEIDDSNQGIESRPENCIPRTWSAVKEPHSVSLKVLRLSRPSLVTQFPIQPPLPPNSLPELLPPSIPASLAYPPSHPHDSDDDDDDDDDNEDSHDPNPDPFILSPILNLPPSFGSAYVGETFSCTLCASHDALNLPDTNSTTPRKTIRDVRITAEMKTPGAAPVPATATTSTKLDLISPPGDDGDADLPPGATRQRIVNFDLKEEGNYVLAVTVSYYEATDVSGRIRTFRKLYQFVCKASLIVRTKAGPLDAGEGGRKRWVLEAQLENCAEERMWLERVVLEVERGLGYRDCNGWGEGRRPVLGPGEVEQGFFVDREVGDEGSEGGGGGEEDGWGLDYGTGY
ncbi:hypothetical protein B0T18DRAFT_491190 [Schizothecium vesticola]|uniref:K Homology domain-containing protein n=1 Tax=Schizothecium vesticola TaxID=314040 RepID=A0AA40EJP3_9PEZI|nr:hypothetical protein B0T18DRAFT_491190 [Schizothecium vesticola]